MSVARFYRPRTNIKFRLWVPPTGVSSEESGCMVEWAALTQSAFNRDNVHSLYKAMCVDAEPGTDYQGSVLMQWTGCRDRTGRDIYDGDIVEHQVIPNGKIRLGVVAWQEVRACWAVWGPNRCVNSNLGSAIYRSNELSHTTPEWLADVKIVGNIHENPELLDETESVPDPV